jgi:hypothetical protein
MLATGCWTDEVAHGYLAVEFEDGELLTRPIIIPPAEDGEYRLYYALESRDKICLAAAPDHRSRGHQLFEQRHRDLGRSS